MAGPFPSIAIVAQRLLLLDNERGLFAEFDLAVLRRASEHRVERSCLEQLGFDVRHGEVGSRQLLWLGCLDWHEIVKLGNDGGKFRFEFSVGIEGVVDTFLRHWKTEVLIDYKTL